MNIFKRVRYSVMNNYQKSNSITTIEFGVGSDAKFLVEQLLASQFEEDRQRLGDALLDELADSAEIDIVRLKISDARQYHKKRGGKTVYKQYGYYHPSSQYIYITNRTAVRGQLLAPKTFLDTLLHEWMHHYDFKKLGLNSIHTKGFYIRLQALKELLSI